MQYHRPILLAATIGALAAVLLAGGWHTAAQSASAPVDADSGRAALERALAEGRDARERARKLEASAASARDAVAKTARERAALAARIQQSEAAISAAEARIALLGRERAKVRARLSERERPIVRLTGALQKFARRPVAVSVLKPGSLREAVYLRAMLSSTIPLVANRTGDLKAELERGRALEREALQAAAVLRRNETELEERRERLAALETRQRLASRDASGLAARESDRALALAEQARDLDGLVDRLEEAGGLRRELAALPGPRLRPRRPNEARVAAAVSGAPTGTRPSATGAPRDYRLPVAGRIVTGFGAPSASGTSQGIAFAPRGGAQVVAPAAGRVAYAGRYRGYGRIVIIEHDSGWTSLITGLARVDVAVGEALVGGAPLGIAPPGNGAMTLEVRQDGEPVNPLGLIN